MAKEAYLPHHKWLEDAALLAPPAGGPFTALTLFVCTYVARLNNLHMGFAELTQVMCQRPHGCLLAINSNFGHAAQLGCERYLKAPKPPPVRRCPTRGRPRKGQGDGTCFNSAIEPVIAIDHPDLAEGKVYFVKCFPTTGETQVPGVVLPDLSDGHLVLEAFVAYLNELGVGDEEPDGDKAPASAAPRPRRPVLIARERPNMINYKFRLVRASPRVLVNLYDLAAYLCLLEHTKATAGNPLSARHAALFAGWPLVVLPPFAVRETKAPIDDVKVSFRFREEKSAPRVNIFQEGKVNILGAGSTESAGQIYDFFVRLFAENWEALVSLKPRSDLERRQALRAPPRPDPAPAPPPAALSNSEVDAFLADVLQGARGAAAGLGSPAGQPALGEAKGAGELGVALAPAQGALASAVDEIVSDLGAEEWGFETGDSRSGSDSGSDSDPEEGPWGGVSDPEGGPAPVWVGSWEEVPRYQAGVHTFGERRHAKRVLYAYREEGRVYRAWGPPLGGPSQDAVLGQVDGQRIQDDKEDSL